MNLRRVDLNLLVMLDLMLEERHVTRAAHRLALTQSAASNALERLRGLFEDPLLVRANGGMRLTAYAESIREPLRALIAGVHDLLGPSAVFNPAAAQRRLRIAMSDFAGMVLLPELAKAAGAKAPGIELIVRPLVDASETQAELEAGQLDLAIGTFGVLRDPLLRASLLQDTFVCLMRVDHPAARGRLTASRLLRYPGIEVAGFGMAASTRAAHHSHRSARNVMSVPHYFVVPPILRETDSVALVPKRVWRANPSELLMRCAPLDIAPLHCEMAWHQRCEREDAQCWLRAEIQQIAQRL